MAHPNAEPADATPIGSELDEALGQVEAELLHKGSDLVPLLNEAQGKLAAKLKEALSYYDEP
jgi:hypothetical protein